MSKLRCTFSQPLFEEWYILWIENDVLHTFLVFELDFFKLRTKNSGGVLETACYMCTGNFWDEIFFFERMFLFKNCFGAQAKLFELSGTNFFGISVVTVSTCLCQRSYQIYNFWQKVIKACYSLTAVKKFFGLSEKLFQQAGQNFIWRNQRNIRGIYLLMKFVLGFVLGVWAENTVTLVKIYLLLAREVFQSEKSFLSLYIPIGFFGHET